MDISEDIHFFNNLDEAISKYSEQIKLSFEFLNNQHQTGFDEVDTKRFETRQCIVFNLGISAIVMTSVTLEECLKTLLKYHFMLKNHDEKVDSNLSEIEGLSLDAEKNFGFFNLHNSIEKAFKENLITTNEKDRLMKIKEFVRNAFIHSHKSKIFDPTIKTQVSSFSVENNKIKLQEEKLMNILGFSIAHGLAQARLAKENSRIIFEEVDSLIITICDRFWSNREKSRK